MYSLVLKRAAWKTSAPKDLRALWAVKPDTVAVKVPPTLAMPIVTQFRERAGGTKNQLEPTASNTGSLTVPRFDTTADSPGVANAAHT